MFKVMMIVDGQAYVYGTYNDRERANEIAIDLRVEREIDTYVVQVEE